MSTKIKFGICFVALAAFGFANSESAFAQTVQLPTFSTSGVGTTVMVPDGGSAFLGGVSRNSISGSSRSVPILGGLPGTGRLFRNDGYGRSTGTSSHRVHVRIIDQDEMDRAVLAEAARRRGATHDILGRPIDGAVAGKATTSATTISGGRTVSGGQSNSGLSLGNPSTNSQSQSQSNREAAIRKKAAFITRNIGK